MNMRKLVLSILLIIITFFSVGCTSNNSKLSYANNSKQLTQEEKLDDFKYMYTILKENYPYFEVNKRSKGIDWLSKESEFISKIKSTNDDESFFNALQSNS